MKTEYAVAKKNALIPTLYLGNLSFKMREEGLEKFLSSFGKVTYLYIVKDKRSKKSKGIAFAQFSKKEEFEKALKILDGKTFMGRTLKASQAVENESMPFPLEKKEIKEKKIVREETHKKKVAGTRVKVKKGLELLESIRGTKRPIQK